MTKRELMERAIAEKRLQAQKNAVAYAPKVVTLPPPPPVTLGVKPTKAQRSAEARDARAKARGRLPKGTVATLEFRGGEWAGGFKVPLPDDADELHHKIVHRAPGLFQLLEELDVLFWEWVVTLPPGEAPK